MINMNKRMEELLRQAERSEGAAKIRTLAEEIVSRTGAVGDCVLFDREGDLDETEIDFDNVLRLFKDRTGYEISCNELRFSQEELPTNQFLHLTERLDAALSQKYMGRKFAIILIVNGEWIDVRFHTYRKEEDLWLDEDLNQYNDPILYRVVRV